MEPHCSSTSVFRTNFGEEFRFCVGLIKSIGCVTSTSHPNPEYIKSNVEIDKFT